MVLATAAFLLLAAIAMACVIYFRPVSFIDIIYGQKEYIVEAQVNCYDRVIDSFVFSPETPTPLDDKVKNSDVSLEKYYQRFIMAASLSSDDQVSKTVPVFLRIASRDKKRAVALQKRLSALTEKLEKQTGRYLQLKTTIFIF
jgi:hypothetical protein